MQLRLATFFILIMCALQARQVDRFADLLPFIDEETLLIVDVHNTLLTPQQQLGTRRWTYCLYHDLLKQGTSPTDARQEVWRRMRTVTRATRMRPVEPGIPQLICELQDAQVAIMACTGSPGNFCEVIPNQLYSNSIDLTRTAPQIGGFELSLSGDVRYQEGILYADDGDKGEALKAFFVLAGIQPKRVVFVDDGQRHVDSVKRALEEVGIETVAVRYDAALRTEPSLERAVTDLQWQMMGQILSDEQARALLKTEDSQ
jgi:phosphoserine phosphatase